MIMARLGALLILSLISPGGWEEGRRDVVPLPSSQSIWGAREQSLDDAGTPDAGADAGPDAGAADAGASDCTPAAPTADGGCGIQPTVFTSNYGCSSGSGGFAAALGLLAAAALLRRRRRNAGLLALALLGATAAARAEQPYPAARAEQPYPPFSDEKPAFQRVAITSSPLAYFIAGRIGASASLLLFSHHALELTLFHIALQTGSDSNNQFTGWGQELGYRYYSGEDGPRGFFIGPSLLLGHYTATPLVGGDQIRYSVPGVALDLGYQALVLDKIVIGLGVGAQYTRPSATLPTQEIPSSTYANAGVRPRVLFALGFSFLSI